MSEADDYVRAELAKRRQQMSEARSTAYYIAGLADPSQTLESIYAQFKMFRTAPDDYHLPEGFLWAESVICGFDREDHDGFLEFARAVLDEFPKRSESRKPVQAVYRKINSWADACRRRSLIDLLEHGYQKNHGHLPLGVIKRNYIEKILKMWSEERQAGLSSLSRYGKSEYQERIDFLNEFWRQKKQAAFYGQLPHWKEVLGASAETPIEYERDDEDESTKIEPEKLSERDELQIFAGRVEAMAVALKVAVDASSIMTKKVADKAALLLEMASDIRSEINRL